MEKTIICPVGDRPDAVFPALREFKVKHVHMLVHPDHLKEKEQLEKDLKRFGITISEAKLSPNVWEDTFAKISDFAKHHPEPQHVMVHVGTGSRDMQCAATSASFVNGLQALNGTKDMLMGLPVMKFSYYSLLQDRKLKIMEALRNGKMTLNDIASELNISLSLLSYHVHGNRKSEGLIEMGIVELEDEGNQSSIELSPMGRLILKGYLPECEVC